MAGTAVTVGRATGRQVPPGELEQIRLSLNKVVTDLETLRAGLDAVCDLLDADSGVTGTNYASTAAVATAGTMTAYTVATQIG